MKYLVIDVAAEYGGAVTVLNQFIEEFLNDNKNDYFVVVSKLDYENKNNVRFIRKEWVKKSYLHRVFFDNIYISFLINKYKPDIILSLQNKPVKCRNIRQEVFFHNALPISNKRFKLHESKSLWIYQTIIGNIIRRRLKKADMVYVQADWIKKTLIDKWGLSEEKIKVKHQAGNFLFKPGSNRKDDIDEMVLFYPANTEVYKNHLILLKALSIVKTNLLNQNSFKLVLTCDDNSLNKECIDLIRTNNIPVVFVGRLTPQEMQDWYLRSVLVFPSYIETLGLPLAEAKTMDCIIIAADCEYAHETVGEYDKVFYFNPYSDKDLAMRILEVYDNMTNRIKDTDTKV